MSIKRKRAGRADISGLAGLFLGIAVVLVGQRLEGGEVRSLLQSTAAVVVFGGTLTALLVSFPLTTLSRTLLAIRDAFLVPPPALRGLVSELTDLANRAKRKGLMSLENFAIEAEDKFLGRALGLATDGMPPEMVRRAMEAESHLLEDTDEEAAHVLESAAGYAPTLGILGAVLGLIHVMENLAAPSKLGSGIAVAFVATVYGVGSANLILMPLAAKIRQRVRAGVMRREMIIESVIGMQQGIHPRMLEEQLQTYLRIHELPQAQRKAA